MKEKKTVVLMHNEEWTIKSFWKQKKTKLSLTDLGHSGWNDSWTDELQVVQDEVLKEGTPENTIRIVEF